MKEEFTFYYPNGDKIEPIGEKSARDIFVEVYNCNYYSDFAERLAKLYGEKWSEHEDKYNVKFKKNMEQYSKRIRYGLKNVQGNKTEFEDDIDKVLEKGFLTDEAKEIMKKYEIRQGEMLIKKQKDVPSTRLMIYTCFAWKTQKIKVDTANPFILSFDSRCYFDENIDCILLGDFGGLKRAMHLNKDFFDAVVNAARKPNDIVQHIFDIANPIQFLGATYAIALWFFVTKGNEPIYDRFADKALRAIINDSDFNDPIEKHDFQFNKVRNSSEDTKASIASLLTDDGSMYQLYIETLTELFGNRWKTDRRIDRALWVYGHLFLDKEPKKTKPQKDTNE